jgi:uncharacterized protein (DUF433 family)
VQRDPAKLSGAPTVRAWRITPDAIVDNYDAGLTEGEISEQFGLPLEDIHTILEYAATSRKSARPA